MKRSTTITLSIFTLLVLLVVQAKLRYRLLPVSYDYNENTSGGTPGLVPLSVGDRFAKTANGDVIFAINGQPNHDWVCIKENPPYWTGVSWVAPKKSVKPLDFSDMPISEIQIIDFGGTGKVFASTRDQAILNEFMYYSRHPKRFFPPVGQGTWDIHIRLLSPAIRGMAYEDEVVFTPPSVYSTHMGGTQLGPKVTKWIYQEASKMPD